MSDVISWPSVSCVHYLQTATAVPSLQKGGFKMRCLKNLRRPIERLLSSNQYQLYTPSFLGGGSHWQIFLLEDAVFFDCANEVFEVDAGHL